MDPGAVFRGAIARFLPSMFFDDRDDTKPTRLDRYGAVQIGEATASDVGYAEEGSFFQAVSPTLGTGLTWVAAQTAFLDTTPNFYFFNAEPSDGSGRSIALRYMKLILTAVATAAVSIRYAFYLDNVARALTTDNTVALTVKGVNGRGLVGTLPAGFIAKGQNSATASVIAARSQNAVLADQGTIGGLNIAGDIASVVWGNYDGGTYLGTADVAGQPSVKRDWGGPLLIPPGWSLTGHIWLPSSSASFTPECIFGFRAK